MSFDYNDPSSHTVVFEHEEFRLTLPYDEWQRLLYENKVLYEDLAWTRREYERLLIATSRAYMRLLATSIIVMALITWMLW